MKLFTNGCSFTWGGGILEEERGLKDTLVGTVSENDTRYRLEAVWTFQLHKLLNTDEVVNYGIGCGSNARIVRTTIDFFVERINAGEDVSNWTAIIQWTEPSRYEVFNSKTNSYDLIKFDVVLPRPDKHRFEYLQRRFFEDEKLFDDEWHTHMVALSSFFDKWNIKYLFSSMGPMNVRNDFYSKTMCWLGETPETSMLIDIDDLRYDSGHPNLLGHKYIAQRIFNRLNK